MSNRYSKKGVTESCVCFRSEVCQKGQIALCEAAGAGLKGPLGESHDVFFHILVMCVS